MNGINGNKKIAAAAATNNLTKRLDEYEVNHGITPTGGDDAAVLRHIQLELERKFEKRRAQTEEERQHREPRHYWWDLMDERHCCYFPKDNYTHEEHEYYKAAVRYMETYKHDAPFALESTRKAFEIWYYDNITLELDKKRFPNHNHGPHDYWHDQLHEQAYYTAEYG